MNQQVLDPSAPYFLDCSPEYLAADELERFKICNGCGSAQAKFDFVPNHIYRLSITEACHVHDWDYHFGKNEAERLAADTRFLNNMFKLIEHESNFLMRIARRRRALKYYEAVRELGGKAFWAGKTRTE